MANDQADHNERKPKHLVLCVHGIGNQRPGETVDAVLSGALAEHNRDKNAIPLIADETIVNLFEEKFESYDGRMDPKTIDGVETCIHNEKSVELPNGEEGPAPKREGMQSSFPMHIKRVRKQGSSNVETLMAEVYWADLSPEPKGAFGTIFDLIKVVTSIGYLALDNAANVDDRDGYKSVSRFLQCITAGVVALNATLLMGVLVLLLEGTLFTFDGSIGRESASIGAIVLGLLAVCAAGFGIIANRTNKNNHWKMFKRLSNLTLLVAVVLIALSYLFGALPPTEVVIASTGVLTIIFGKWIGATRWDYSMWRMFSQGAGGWGLVLMICVPLIPMALSVDFVKGICSDIDIAFCGPINDESFGPEQIRTLFFVNLMMLALSVVLLVSILLCLRVHAVSNRVADTYDDSAPTQQRRMYPAICSALLLLWLVMSSSFWMAMKSTTDGMRTVVVKKDACSKFGMEFTAKDGGHCHEPAGILHTAFASFIEAVVPIMAVAVLFLVVLGIVGAKVVSGWFKNKDIIFGLTQSQPKVGRLLLNERFQNVFKVSTWALLAISVLQIGQIIFATVNHMNIISLNFLELLMSFVPPLLLGLALLVYQLREKVAGGLGAFRDIVVYANNNELKFDAGLDNFPPRKKIENRFERACDFLLEQLHPELEKVTLICHSQGTVVTTRNVRRCMKAATFKGLNVTLVTMGSPVTHLYRKYFPREFRVEAEDFAGISWYNIGRTDDFVGTYIENLDEINGGDKNVPPEASKYNLYVPAGGHPGYFTDPYVWQHFTNKIGFRLVD